MNLLKSYTRKYYSSLTIFHVCITLLDKRREITINIIRKNCHLTPPYYIFNTHHLQSIILHLTVLNAF